jgi:hypothetical protein
MPLLVAVVVIASVAIVYLPQDLLSRKEKLSGKELAKIAPGSSWVGEIYPFIQILWLVLAGLFYVAVGIGQQVKEVDRFLCLLVAWLLSDAVLDGLIAVHTGVYPVPTRGGKYLYVHENSSHLRRIGRIQISLALVMTIAAALRVLLT